MKPLSLFLSIQIQAPEVSHEEHPLTDSEDETGKIPRIFIDSFLQSLLWPADLAEKNTEVMYPEIGYFELGSVIDNLNIRKHPTKGSRMSLCLSLADECRHERWLNIFILFLLTLTHIEHRAHDQYASSTFLERDFSNIRADLDMLGDASCNVHMQYLREGVLTTEAEDNKLNQTSFIKVKSLDGISNCSHWFSIISRKNQNIKC